MTNEELEKVKASARQMTPKQMLNRLLNVEDALRKLVPKNVLIAGDALVELNHVIFKLQVDCEDAKPALQVVQ